MKVNVVHILPFDLYMFILDIDFFYSKCLYSKNPLIYYNSYKLIFKKKGLYEVLRISHPQN